MAFAHSARGRRVVTLAGGALAVYALRRLAARPEPARLRITRALNVARPRQELYDLWRDLSNLPRLLSHIESVTAEDGRSHWIARLDGLPDLSWDAEVVEEHDGRRLAWRSLPGSELHTAGAVSFEDLPAGRGTGLRVELEYGPPGGRAMKPVAALLKPVVAQQIANDLRRLKAVLETGHAPTTEGPPAGRRASAARSGALSSARSPRGAEQSAPRNTLPERSPRRAERFRCRDREDSFRAAALDEAPRGAERGAFRNDDRNSS